MKAPLLTCLLSLPLSLWAQGTPEAPVIVDAGPHHTVWQRVSLATDEQGQSVPITNTWTELGTGLNWLKNPLAGEWERSVEGFEVTPEGHFVALRGQHRVIVADRNISQPGAVDLELPDGQRLISTPMCLSLFSPASARTVLLAEVRDCPGELVEPNVVLFPSAFDALPAALVYKNTKAGFDQSVVILANPGSPQEWGFAEDDDVRLEVWTEWFNPPEPIRTPLRTAEGLESETLDFGSMQMVEGRAFVLHQELDSVEVQKSWQRIRDPDDGLERVFLIESVRYQAVAPMLERLQARATPPAPDLLARRTTQGRWALASLLARRTEPKDVQLAAVPRSAWPRDAGFVLDYELVNSTHTNFTFKGDGTYYVSGPSYLYQTTTIEGGAVVKFANTNSAALWVMGAVDCQTSPYRMAVFSAKDDDSAGEIISGSSGNPSGTYALYALRFYSPPAALNVHHLRVAHAFYGMQFYSQSGHAVRHCQFVKCNIPIYGYATTINAGNLLVHNAVIRAFHLNSATATGEHLTLREVSQVAYPANTLYLTNSLLVSITNWSYAFYGAYNATNSGDGVFATVGAGSNYLAAGSAYRNAGTSNINPTLAKELKSLTTYPPILLTNDFTVNTTLSPQTQRDTDALDLGWHYDPLDYCWSGLNLTNATLTLTNGVAVGFYGASGTKLRTGAKFISQGTPANLNRLARYEAVQERSYLWGAAPVEVFNNSANSPYPEARLTFTDVSMMGNSPSRRNLVSGNTALRPLAISHSQLRGLYLHLDDSTVSTYQSLNWTNNVFERCTLELLHWGYYAPFSLTFYNNLFVKGTNYFYTPSLTYPLAWTVKDCLFDSDSLTHSGQPRITNSNNGYRTNLSTLQGGSSNKTNLLISYQAGPATNGYGVLEAFYYPTNGGTSSLTNLFNTGSRSATNAGLYHFTTTTNQVKEAGSVVDIGFHYVALNASSQPADTDGDGLADYAEDRNGNGAGTDDPYSWTSADTNGDGLGDLQALEVSYNVLVNDPAQDYGNEQNTQFESTCAVLNGNVIVAYVDANQGVYGLGHYWETYPGLPTPRFVGYSVSRDNGVAFEDKGNPPLSTQGAGTSDDGDAGDPVLAVDRASQIVYLAGTSPRNAGWKGIPLWKSTDGGLTFTNPPINVCTNINYTDKPWIAVDNAAGTGQHDVYLTFSTSQSSLGLWLTVSTNGSLDNWSVPLAISEVGVSNVTAVNCSIPVLGPAHSSCVFWFERTAVGTNGTNWLKMRPILNRGSSLGDTRIIRRLVTTNATSGNLELKRSNTADAGDTFRAFPFPVPAVNPNPSKSNHLYVAYADKVTNSTDKADIFFLRSTNGGTNWTNPERVNTDSGTNDQWMPVLAVKPDGTRLFVAWYDRRNDTNNSAIDVYGRWGTIATDGAVTFGTEFKITTTNFPPVFAGTLPANTSDGHYDPVYPPGGVNLNWHYGSAWPAPPPEPPDENVTDPAWRDHVGEYDGAWSEGCYVYVTWTDSRSTAAGTLCARPQRDTRLVRVSWPQ